MLEQFENRPIAGPRLLHAGVEVPLVPNSIQIDSSLPGCGLFFLKTFKVDIMSISILFHLPLPRLLFFCKGPAYQLESQYPANTEYNRGGKQVF